MGTDKKPEKERNWLSAEEIAEDLNMSVTTVRAWIRDQKLRAGKFGRDYRVQRADYEEFIEKSYHFSEGEQKPKQ